ncbi:hypothetical protein D9M68_928810 [compost metagenome]
MLNIEIRPAVRGDRRAVDLGLELTQPDNIAVALGRRVVDQVVELGEAEVSAPHDLTPSSLEVSACAIQSLGRVGQREGLEDVGRGVADPCFQGRSVGDRPQLMQA